MICSFESLPFQSSACLAAFEALDALFIFIASLTANSPLKIIKDCCYPLLYLLLR
jgi:hypothetical protein